MADDSRAAQAQALLADMGDVRADHVASLEERKRALQRERQQVANCIKAAQKKRQRLLDKARGLTDADLLSVVATRAASVKAKAEAKAKAQR